jgi:endonuclease/exonuclease/phosphatase family metal-dependent hydrolase
MTIRSITVRAAAAAALAWLTSPAAFAAQPGGPEGQDATEAQTIAPAPIVLDGLRNDWAGLPVLGRDPSGDADGPFDVTRVKATMHGTQMLLAFDTATDRHNLQSGDDGERSLVIVVEAGERSIEIDTRARRVVLSDGQADASGNWATVNYRVLPTYASPWYEATIDLAPLGVEPGETVTIDFRGSDELLTPVQLRVPEAEQPRATASSLLERERAESTLRLIAYNTEHEGLVSDDRADAFGRLLRALAADVLCIQEEWDTTEAQAAAALATMMPPADGRSWTVVKAGGCLLASRHEIIRVPTGDQRIAAGVVVPNGDASRAILALSVHFKCCGHAGSDEDDRRVREARAAAEVIDAVRNAAEGSPLHPYRSAPAVVAGDWNLVGSRAPLDVLTDEAGGPGLTDARPLCLTGGNAFTWVSENSSFCPGRLDLIAYDAEQLAALRSFVLDTRDLPDASLNAMGLRRNDTRDASDHLPLIIDLRFKGEDDER